MVAARSSDETHTNAEDHSERAAHGIPEGIGRHQATVKSILKPLFDRLWNFEVSGLHNVPPSGPAILCPNHAAAIDSAFVPAVLDRRVIFVGKSEYLDDWKTKRLLPALGMIPLDRRGGDHAKAALNAAREVLLRGDLFGIYPEGTRSRSGKLHKGHTGAARLAVETGVPIIPVGLLGTAAVQPPGKTRPRFRKTVTVRFGQPIFADRYAHRVGDRVLYRELIDEVMFELQRLTGLDYEHTYAGVASKQQPETAERGTEPHGTTEPGAEVLQPSRPTLERQSSAEVLVSPALTSLDELVGSSF